MLHQDPVRDDFVDAPKPLSKTIKRFKWLILQLILFGMNYAQNEWVSVIRLLYIG